MGPGTENIPTVSVEAESLKCGMVLVSWDRPDVEILGERETWEDRFGIERLKYWAKRLDTGQEGYMTYGYGAKVPVRRTSSD